MGMAIWADNIKFVKEIIDNKYSKIDNAAAEVMESLETLQKDSNCSKSREHLRFGVRTLELITPEQIEKLLETIVSDMHGKEKESLEIEKKTKISKRDETLERAKQIKSQLKL